MFEPMEKDFKSPVSTIPPRGQVTENTEQTQAPSVIFEPSLGSEATQDVGTVAQFPARTGLCANT